MSIQSLNPKNGVENGRYHLFDTDMIESVLEQSQSAFLKHKNTSFDSRAHQMLAVADYLDENAQDLGLMITNEMGKLLSSAVAEVHKCAQLCRYYAQNAEDILGDQLIETKASQSYVRYLPIGAIFAVMPWNFPFWQVFRFAVPALMAGNVCLLKHASNVPECALEIERIFNQCGFGNGEFQTLLIKSSQVEHIIADDRVRAVTLTGSEAAGASVAAAAGKYLKKSVLELGGSDPFIVMPSANFDESVDLAVRGRVQNNGQTCVASKRYIIHADIYDAFKAALVARYEALVVGDPCDEKTDIGPLSTHQIQVELDIQVQETLNMGATHLCGAHIIESEGHYYQPGLLENIPKGSPAYDNELFGPVGLLYKVADFDEAIALANDTRFGLGSVICTQDKGEIERAVNELDAGGTFVNTLVVSDARLPFGGTKASGYGRELSAEGIREFCNIKTIYIA